MLTKAEASTQHTPAHRAAIYVRMSTDPQINSIQHQRDKLYEYAEARGIEIVAMYADAGKSGLHINGRDGMKNLLDDVQGGQAGFDQILVYDVSRWGRYQDLDESAHYEFICRRAGIKVVYCGEQFADDGSTVSGILKNIKRVMAAEYSRELSSKVFAAQSKYAALGYKQGGPAGYGLRRAVMGQDGKVARLLEPGGRKGPTSERVVFVAGPASEIAVVQEVYRYYVEEHIGESKIATLLNDAGIPGEHGRCWSFNTVRGLLTNEKYIGTLVYNRSSFKLHNRIARNPSSDWIKVPHAFSALVPEALFQKAAAERLYRMRHFSRADLLEKLRSIYRTHGRVTTGLIDNAPGVPHHSAFSNAFGTLLNAYALAGVPPTAKAKTYINTLWKIETIRNAIVADVRAATVAAGGTCSAGSGKNSVVINGTLLVKVLVSRGRQYGGKGPLRWKIPLVWTPTAHFVIVVQLDLEHRPIRGYLLLPTAQFHQAELTEKSEVPLALAEFRHATIDAMFGLDEKRKI